MAIDTLAVCRPEPNWRTLFPEVDGWIAGAPEQDLDAQSLIVGSNGRADVALSYAEFCWPSFVVVDDMVLRGYVGSVDLEEAVQYWLKIAEGNKLRVEWMLNHEHFWHLMQNCPPTAEVAMHWGQLVREMWTAKLARDFPSRRFEVELHSGPDVERMDHQITFFELR